MRFLFLAVHAPNRAPGQRFRFEQYLDSLRARGIECDYSWALDGKDAQLLYSAGNVARKALLTLRLLAKRWLETLSLHRYDLVFVQREAMFLGGPVLELGAKRHHAKLVFDFDDAIWLADTSSFNQRFRFLKSPSKIPRILKAADLVLAGNSYLAEYARPFNPHVQIVPTTIDTDSYTPRARPRDDGRVCVGWSGSFSTIRDFRLSLPTLRRLRARFGDQVQFKVIGDGSFRDDALGIVGQPWKADTEVADLHEIDIGMMPLPDNDWSRGKCGLKGLQYMALGIPTLMSPVGVNAEIIDPGKNGFLPRTDEEWEQALARLIEAPALRAEIGAAGRRRVVEHYSVRAWRDRYCDMLSALAERAPRSAAAVPSPLERPAAGP
jgi:glycosyltransferase involved in cell wall biosynthesis